jgi:hypothetical protein
MDASLLSIFISTFSAAKSFRKIWAKKIKGSALGTAFFEKVDY